MSFVFVLVAAAVELAYLIITTLEHFVVSDHCHRAREYIFGRKAAVSFTRLATAVQDKTHRHYDLGVVFISFDGIYEENVLCARVKSFLFFSL